MIEECAKRRMWVILDLHGAPGGQSPFDHTGQPKGLGNRLWTSAEYKNRLAHLWKTVAARYATNSAVAGYDLFNEPEPGDGVKTLVYSNSILPVLEMVYRAIRSNDSQHIVFMMSNFMYTNMWNDIWACPAPASRGWSNVVYELHVYDQVVYGRNGVDDWWFSTQKRICDEMIRGFTRLSEGRQVPVYVGEFAPWTERNMEYWIRQCEANGLHWSHWNYRSWGWDDTNYPEKGHTIWGVQYRKKETTNLVPNVMSDSLSVLQEKFAAYNHESYTDNPYLRKVIANHTLDSARSRTRTEFYLNTFSGPNSDGLSAGWPWKKIAGVGGPNKFTILNQKARLFPNSGQLILRCKSREEADARFEINDSTGVRLSVEIASVNVTSEATGPEAEIRIGFARDEITSVFSDYDTRGLMVRLAYDKSGASSNISLGLYAKAGGTNTYGVMLFTNPPIAFIPGAAIELHATKTNASLYYNGTFQGSAPHNNLALDVWPNGAVAFVEVAQVGGVVQYVELDNLKVWRPDAKMDEAFSDEFTNYVSGITALAEPEYLTTQEYWSPSRKTESYVTNNSLFWIAKEWGWGGTWMSPRRDYHNDVRLLASATNVIEVGAAYSGFTRGIGKICLMPEFFTGEIYNEYAGDALYVQFERQGGNIRFEAYRHYNVGGGRYLLQAGNAPYSDGEPISFQADATSVRVLYGTNQVLSAVHGMTNYLANYALGAFPHYEFQNWATTTNAIVLVEHVICRQR